INQNRPSLRSDGCPRSEDSNPINLAGLLRPRRERPRGCAADERDELAPFHRLPNARITDQYSRSEPCIAAKAACSCPSRAKNRRQASWPAAVDQRGLGPAQRMGAEHAGIETDA